MIKAIFLAIAGLVLIVALIGGGKAFQIRDLIRAGEGMSPPPIAVSSEIAQEVEWESTLRAVGALEAAKGVQITADIAGRIDTINFDSGSFVDAGTILLTQEANTELSELRAAEADQALAKSNLDRVSRLQRKKLSSQSELDSADAAYKSASARSQTIKATLEKKQIVAPFSGRLGLSRVDIGQYINAGTPVVSLQAADPMLLNFSLPQHHLMKLKTGFRVNVISNAMPERTFEGVISAIDTIINDSTRSVDIQATLANTNGELLPGMFVTAEVVLPDIETVLIIPSTSISYASYGDSVFIIEEKPKTDNAENDEQQLVARQQFVQLGASKGDYVTVVAGINPGDRVASAGVFKLRNGATVVLNEDVKLDPSLNPSLEDQ